MNGVSNVRAPSGHSLTHAQHLIHNAGSLTVPFSDRLIACVGQASMQYSHCVQSDSSTTGAIGAEAAARTAAFQAPLLAPPVYTRPAEFRGWRVPDVLLSGNFAEIAKWQDNEAYERTKRLRPDLLNE